MAKDCGANFIQSKRLPGGRTAFAAARTPCTIIACKYDHRIEGQSAEAIKAALLAIAAVIRSSGN
jgi:hypothetical protein